MNSLYDLIINAGPNHVFATTLAGIFGLLIGSFLNVVIYRVPQMMQRESDNYVASESGLPLPHTDDYNLMAPRSACPQCGHKISALENIPVISYLALRGKCAACKTPISARYPVVELLTAMLSAALIWHFGSGLAGLGTLVFLYLLIAMTFIDADTQLLPDDLTLPLMWCGLLINLQGTFVPLHEAVIGAAAGYMSLWLVNYLFELIRKKQGMGHGDFKLLAALGAWLGWKMLPVIILMSSLVGAVVGIILIVLAKRGVGVPIPFGPYLAVAGVVSLLYGQSLAQALIGIS
jgi:leader peptidase (prepilin peptidase)/N-methyltransferase